MDFEKNLFPQDEQPQTPADIPAENELTQDAVPCSPTDEEVLFDLNQPQEEPVESAPKKKSKKGLVIGIIAAAAAVALLLGILFLTGVFDRKSQSSPAYEHHEELIAKMESSLYSLTDKLSNAICNLSLQENAPSYFFGTFDARLQLGDKLSMLLKAAMLQAGLGSNTDWLENITLSADTNGTDSLSQFLLTLGLGDTSILSVDRIEDPVNNHMYLGMPGLNPYYLQTELNDADASLMSFNTLMQQGSQMLQELIDALPEEKALQTSLRGYADLLLAQLTNPTSSSQVVTIGEVTQTYDAVVYQIPTTKLLDLAEAILERAENDDALELLITAISHFATDLTLITDPYGTEPDMYGLFLETIESAKDELKAAREQVNKNSYLEVTVYLDSNADIRGYQFDAVSDADKSVTILSWLSIVSGKETSISIRSDAENVRLVGTYSTQSGAFSGNFDLHADDQRIFSLSLENMQIKDEAVYGSIQLTPSEEIWESFLNDAYSVVSMLGTQLGVRIDFDGDTIGMHLTSMGSPALSLIARVTPHEPKPISLPDAESILSGPDAETEWLSHIDEDALRQKLEEAGIPAALFDKMTAA